MQRDVNDEYCTFDAQVSWNAVSTVGALRFMSDRQVLLLPLEMEVTPLSSDLIAVT